MKRLYPLMNSFTSSNLSCNPYHLVPIVRGVEIKDWSLGNKTSRVHIRMTLVVMQLDVVKIARFLNPWLLVKVFEIVPEIGVFINVTQVALEVDVIDGIEAHQCREHTPVGFGDGIATQIALLLQNFFPVIKGVE